MADPRQSYSFSIRDLDYEKNDDLEESNYSKGFSSVTDSDTYSETHSEADNVVDCSNTGADQKEVDRVCKIIDELFGLDRNMEAVLDECRINLTHDLVIDVLERFRHARKPAFRFFCWAGQNPGFDHDSRTYNKMMNVLAKNRQFETMVAMLEEMGAEGVLTMETFVISMKAFAAAKERKKAVGIFELMKKYKYKVGVDTINCLLDSLGRVKLAKEAQTLFEKLRDRLLREMQEKGCPPDGRTYNALIKLLTGQRMPHDAMRVYEKMIQEGVQPTIHTFNMIIKSFFQTRNYDMGRAIWDEMSKRGICPDDNSYTVFIGGLISLGRSGEACKYFEEMMEKGMKAPQLDYNKFAADFSRAGKADILEDLAEKMKFSGKFDASNTFTRWAEMMKKRRRAIDSLYLGGQATAEEYTRLLLQCVRANDVDRAKRLQSHMDLHCFPPNDTFLHKSSPSLYAKFGKISDARNLFDKMPLKDVISWNAMLSAYAKSGSIENLTVGSLLCCDNYSYSISSFQSNERVERTKLESA
ncbi:hypothetical protein CCACVL1_05212 [Corchorus capsularis]|uniref:Pentacotripeptide-repeat region of PRORP domain-containing protein n=1 Tax=Corchorus capsularis TaxID=210143 RepID=A0A1R3JM08_COCAP|nr:hypothetical protein CCACVL1_05212 [Corchorus capsularis]